MIFLSGLADSSKSSTSKSKTFAAGGRVATKIGEAEAEALLKHVPKNAVLIALDEHGKQRNSTEFSRWIETLKVRGHSHIVFALGGPDGHGKDLLEAAQYKMSLSQMTMTHELARIVLFEQLYRAGSLLAGHPYHRD